MASQYKTIKGVRYERDLLQVADEEKSSRGRLIRSSAERLWDRARDGGRVTETERRTLRYVLDHYPVNSAAKIFLEEKLDQDGAGSVAVSPRGSRAAAEGAAPDKKKPYYKRIGSKTFDRALLESAESLVTLNGAISSRGALQLWADAHDGNGVTATERRTLEYIAETFPFDHTGGSRLLRAVLAPEGSAAGRLLDDAGSPAQRASLEGARPTSTRSRADNGGGARRGTGALRDRSRSRERPSTLGGSALALPSGSESASGGMAPFAALRRWAGSIAAFCRPSRRQQSAANEAAGSGAPRGLEDSLAPEVASLLREGGAEASQPLEIMDRATPARESDAVEVRRAEAVKEVARILSAKSGAEILGGGTNEEQQREFRRLALLLHPDKPWASQEESFNLAYRLVLAAKSKKK